MFSIVFLVRLLCTAWVSIWWLVCFVVDACFLAYVCRLHAWMPTFASGHMFKAYEAHPSKVLRLCTLGPLRCVEVEGCEMLSLSTRVMSAVMCAAFVTVRWWKRAAH